MKRQILIFTYNNSFSKVSYQSNNSFCDWNNFVRFRECSVNCRIDAYDPFDDRNIWSFGLFLHFNPEPFAKNHGI
jgi:hypothetical protein